MTSIVSLEVDRILQYVKMILKPAALKTTLRYSLLLQNFPNFRNTPRPHAALLMHLKKYRAIGNSAIGNHLVLYNKLILKTGLLEVSYGKND